MMSSTLSLSLCNHCHSVSSLKMCTCGQAAYCSKTCQQKDWVRHKHKCPMVVLRQVNGKGKGLVAIRTISAGKVIFTEDPLIVYKKEDQDEHFAHYFKVPGTEQFKKMKPEKKQELMELYDPKELNTNLDCHNDPEYSKFCRIVTANDISINNKAHPSNVSEGLDAVYKQFSRINHSCSPNSFAESDPGSVVMKVRAGRTIKKGEEVTVSYLGSQDGTREMRRDELETTWFFQCACEVCSLTGEEREKNDRVRMLVLTHLMDVGSKDKIIDMLTDRTKISATLSRYLRVLADSYSIESDFGKLAVLLSCCHVFYQGLGRLGVKWVWPAGRGRIILQDKLGENFLDELDKLAMATASVLTRYFKEKVMRILGILDEVLPTP